MSLLIFLIGSAAGSVIPSNRKNQTLHKIRNTETDEWCCVLVRWRLLIFDWRSRPLSLCVSSSTAWCPWTTPWPRTACRTTVGPVADGNTQRFGIPTNRELILTKYVIFNNYSLKAKWIVGNSLRDRMVTGGYSHYSQSLRWIIVWVYATCEHSKNKQDNTFCRDLSVFSSSLFVFISVTVTRTENNIPSLTSQSRDIAQYPEIASQSNCAILGGSRVAYANGCCRF